MSNKADLRIQESEPEKSRRRNWESEEERAELLEECRLFADENGRFPRYRASKGTQERYLAQSVANGLQRGVFTASETAALEEMKRRHRSRRNWESEEERAELLEECRLFADENGRFPRCMAPKGTQEKRIARAVEHGLRRGVFTASETAALEEMKRRHRSRMNWEREEERAELLEECRLFAEENGRFPRRLAPKGTRERHLAQSVANGLKGAFTASETAALEEMKGRHRNRNWESEEERAELLEECRLFAEENGRFPRYKNPKDTRERYLAQSVANGLQRGVFTASETAALEALGRKIRKR